MLPNKRIKEEKKLKRVQKSKKKKWSKIKNKFLFQGKMNRKRNGEHGIAIERKLTKFTSSYDLLLRAKEEPAGSKD